MEATSPFETVLMPSIYKRSRPRRMQYSPAW